MHICIRKQAELEIWQRICMQNRLGKRGGRVRMGRVDREGQKFRKRLPFVGMCLPSGHARGPQLLLVRSTCLQWWC